MASVKFYLDKRNKKQDGTYPLKLTVTHKKPFHIPLGVSISEENWIGNKIEGDIKNKNFLNDYIKSRYSGVENYLLLLKLQNKLDKLSPAELKKNIQTLNSLNEQVEEDKKETILGENYLFNEHAKKFIETREAQGTKNTYIYTLDTLKKHYDLETLTFVDINYDWLEDFDVKLRPTCKTNTRSIHFRNIRAIFKNATKKKLVSKDLYPFDDFSIKTEETAHRNLSVEDLRTFLHFPIEEHQERYRDLFMLQFYLIGINAVDILHAERIHKERLEFRRAKTKRLYSIKIEPEALEIIKKYNHTEKVRLLLNESKGEIIEDINYLSKITSRNRFDVLKKNWINVDSLDRRNLKELVNLVISNRQKVIVPPLYWTIIS